MRLKGCQRQETRGRRTASAVAQRRVFALPDAHRYVSSRRCQRGRARAQGPFAVRHAARSVELLAYALAPLVPTRGREAVELRACVLQSLLGRGDGRRGVGGVLERERKPVRDPVLLPEDAFDVGSKTRRAQRETLAVQSQVLAEQRRVLTVQPHAAASVQGGPFLPTEP